MTKKTLVRAKELAMSKVPRFEKNRILEMLGLQTRSSTTRSLIQGMGVLGVGALVGFGLGLLLAPSSGTVLRGDLRRRLSTTAARTTRRAHDLLDDVQMAGA
jgi:hypothetical protein